jgi:RNA polymerase sigma factor (TIGR02999 family)
MTDAERPDTAQLLDSARRGDDRATAALLAKVHGELRTVAAGYLRRERTGHTLQPTALVNEACLRLLGRRPGTEASRTQLFAMAAATMRRVLVDHARRRGAARRGANARKVTLAEDLVPGRGGEVDVIAVDDALCRLAALDPRQARIVELRFFGGLSDDAIAATLEVSRRTVQGDWSMARAWLRRELGTEPPV